MDKVSVIIPTHKGSDRILVTVNSVLNQTYKNLEVIVVDDNGEGSLEQVKTFKALEELIKNKLVLYIAHQKNINGSAARNTGFSVSKGDFICFLDDDDYLLPNKIMNQLSCFKKSNNDIGAVICGTYFVNEDGIGDAIMPEWDEKHIQRDYLCERMKFNTSAMLIKRELVKMLDGFDVTFRRHQDLEFCLRLMCLSKIKLCSEFLLIKFAVGRNYPASPQIAVGQYAYFESRMSKYLDELYIEDKVTIQCYHKKRLLKLFFIKLDFNGMYGFIREQDVSCTVAFCAVVELLKQAFFKFTKRKLKHTLTFDEYRKLNCEG